MQKAHMADAEEEPSPLHFKNSFPRVHSKAKMSKSASQVSRIKKKKKNREHTLKFERRIEFHTI